MTDQNKVTSDKNKQIIEWEQRPKSLTTKSMKSMKKAKKYDAIYVIRGSSGQTT